MPSPNEIIVLRIAKEGGEIDKKIISRKIGVTNDYASHILDSLARGRHGDGYLASVAPGRYKITRKGVEVLLGMLFDYREELTTKIKWFTFLRDNTDKKIAELESYIEEQLARV